MKNPKSMTFNDLPYSMGEVAKPATSSGITGTMRMNAALEAAAKDSPLVAAKKASVTQQSDAKKTMLASPEGARKVASAFINGNSMAEDEQVQDMMNLDPIAYAAKYGFDALGERSAMAAAIRDVHQTKNVERSNGDAVADSALGVAVGGVNVLGGAAAFGAAAVDGLVGSTMSPYVSLAQEWAGNMLKDQQSEALQERRKMHQIEAELAGEDTEKAYQEALARGDNAALAKLKKYGSGVADVISNYIEDPMMLGDLASEGAGSLLPVTAAARGVSALGKVSATSAVPAIVGITEGGAAVAQTQQQIMGMDEKALMEESAPYRALRQEGIDHEQARLTVARDAGIAAGAMAVPGAVLAGKIGAKFEANPLAAAGGIKGVGSTIAKEAVEEFLQEGNTQLASNVALDQSAEIQTEWDKGVVEAATTGALGGAMVAGGLQAPGASASIAKQMGKAAAGAAGAVIDQRMNAIEEKKEKEAGVDIGSRTKAALEMNETVAALPEPFAEAAPVVEGATQTQPDQNLVRERILKAAKLDEEDQQIYADNFKTMAQKRAENPSAEITRTDVIFATEAIIRDKKAPAEDRIKAALTSLTLLDDLRKVSSDDVLKAVSNLPENDPVRAAHDTVMKASQTVLGSTAITAAEEMISTLTPEMANEIIPAELMETGTQEQKDQILQMVGIIARINPTAVGREPVETALNQLRGRDKSENQNKEARFAQLEMDLSFAQEAIDVFEKVDAERAEIQQYYDSLVEGMDQGSREAGWKSFDSVREEIRTRGNVSNGLPSLQSHYRTVTRALAGGNIKEAERAVRSLKNFARHQMNKVEAYNKHSEGGMARNERVPFEAYGPTGWFKDEKGVYTDAKSPRAVAMVRETHADMKAATRLYNTMAGRIEKARGEVKGKGMPRLKAPKLTAALRQEAQIQKGKVDGSTKGSQPKKLVQEVPVVSKGALGGNTNASGNGPKGSNSSEGDVPSGNDLPVGEGEAVTVTGATGNFVPSQKPAGGADVDGLDVPGNAGEPPGSLTPTNTPPATKPKRSMTSSEAWMQSMDGVLMTGRKKVNYFLKGFKARSKEGSTLLASGDVRGEIENNINSLVTDENVLPRELNEAEQKSVLEVTQNRLPKFMNEMNQKLNEVLSEKTGKKGLEGEGLNFFDRIRSTNEATPNNALDPALFPNSAIANFASMDEKTNTVQIDENVLAATYMAALEWVIQNQNTRGGNMDVVEVNKAMGLSRNTVEGDRKALKEMAMYGTMLQPAVEQVSQKIQTLLGVQPKGDVSVQETQGLMKGLAANAIEYLSTGEDSLLEIETRTIKVPVSKKHSKGVATYTAIRVKEGVKESPLLQDLKVLREPFTKIFTNVQEKDRYIGAPPSRINETQLGNLLSRISKDSAKVLKRLNNIPYRVNLSMLDTMTALGRGLWLDLVGYEKVSEKDIAGMNKNTALSIIGKNNGLVAGYEETLNYVQEAKIHGEQDKQELDEVKIFFDHAVTSVGRVQQLGPITPQGDKTARETISSTISTIDLNNEEQVSVLWLALAQSVGIKVEKLPHASVSLPAGGTKVAERIKGVREEAEKLFSSDWGLGPAVYLMKEHLLGNTPLDKDFVEAIKTARESDTAKKPIEVTVKLIHAVRVAAELELAIEDGAKEFTTGLALEADGKTDGPINAIIHMGTGGYSQTGDVRDGRFTAEDVERMAKGGLFFTGQTMSLNDFYLQAYAKDRAAGIESKMGEDLYHKGARNFETRLKNLIKKRTGKSAEEGAFKDVPEYRVLSQLLKGFDLSGAADRALIKNPLTVFLYGSSVDGIAGKMAAEMVGEFYDIISRAMKAKAQGKIKHLSQYHEFGKDVALVEDIGSMLPYGSKFIKERLAENPAGFSFTDSEMKALVSEIKRSFAEPMAKSIDEVTGGLHKNMQLVVAVSQVQTLLFRERLNSLLKRAQEKKGQLLSPIEMEEIFASLMRIAPIYSAGGEEFQISAMGQYADSGTPVSTTMSDKLKSNASIISAKEASVKAAPFLTIGTGDGQMIMNIYLNGDGILEASLPVFDGVELSVTSAAAASEQINAAVFEGWTSQNTYQAVVSGFSQLLATMNKDDFNKLDVETKKDILKIVNRLREPDSKLSRVTFSDLGDMLNGLEDRAMVSQARKNAIRRMATQTDHMAGAKQPHGREGLSIETNDPTDFDGIASLLNKLYDEELDKLMKREQRAAQKQEGYAEQESPAFKAALENSVAEPVEGYGGVYTVAGKDMMAFMKKVKGMSGEQALVYLDLLRNNPKIRAATYYFGPAKMLEKIKKDRYSDRVDQSSIEYGQSFPNQGLAFIAHMAPETLLHEMLHVATRTKLEEYFVDPETAPENVKIAVKNLRNLVREVKDLTLDEEAVKVLQGQLDAKEDTPADQISELISYVLTNQNLIRVGKEKTSYGPLFNVLRKGLYWFKKMLGIKSDPGNTVFSNIRFNTEVLLRDIREPVATKAVDEATEVEKALNQVFGNNDRLTEIERTFGEKLKNFIDAAKKDVDPMEDPTGKIFVKKTAEVIEGGKALIATARTNGFKLNAREANAAKTVFTAVSSGMFLDPAVTRQISQIYDQFMENMTAQELLEAQGKTNPTTAEIERASSMITYLGTNDGVVSGSTGKADRLAVFVALAAVSPEIRQGLDSIKMPTLQDMQWDSADNWVNSIGRALMNLIMRLSLNRPNQTVAVRQKLDELTMRLGDIQAENKVLVWNRSAQRYAEKANDFASNYVEKGSKKLTGWVNSAQEKVGNDKTKGLAWATTLVTSLGSKEMSKANGEALTRMLNEASGWHEVRSLLRDVRGATDSTKGLLRMINTVKYASDSVRQRYRESIPEVLAKKFGKKLPAETWAEMHQGFGETDILSLGLAEGMDVIRDPSKVAGKIAAEQARLKALAGKFAPKMESKAKALAVFMVRKEVTSRMLLRNAAAIAHLGGENRAPGVAKALKAIQGPDLERTISRLTSLLAYDMLDPKVKENLANLAKTEKDGVESVVATLRATRQSEIQQKTTGVGKANGWKGHVPVVLEEGQSIKILDDVEEGPKAISLGYTRVADYKGDVHEAYRGKRGYYVSDVGGKAAFKQGIAKAVHQSYLGADTNSGLSLDGYTGHAIFNEDARDVTKSILSQPKGIDNLKAGEYLLPVLNDKFEVVGYEYPVDPKHYKALKKDDHLGRMMGVWMGRIVEEQQAMQTNKELLQLLKEKWDNAPVGEKDKTFVNVAKSDDPIIRDAWNTLGWNIKEDAEEIFGKKGFVPVRKDMVDDAIGFRAVSLTDHWTGISRISDKNRERVKGLATAMLGNKAYRIMKLTEDNVQEAVSYAKTTIVVRSVLVAYENIVSNIFHLSVLGVSLPEIVRVGRQKFIETTQFVENQEKIRELEVELARLVNKPAEKARTEGRIAALKEANARMSIAPLIEAGEFSTVSENLTEADVAIRGGKWADYIERTTDKLPGWTPALAKNLLITKDTALFQGLNRMIQYGDFVAKAVLYEHMTKVEKKSQEEALDTVLEEFVQYNRLAGRGRDNLESWGLLWFYNYKLRIMKIALKAFREKPLSALLMNAWAPGAGIDTAYSGSLPGAGLDGRLGYSFGPEMGLNSLTMNPWFSLTR